jgi:hypothetical protein
MSRSRVLLPPPHSAEHRPNALKVLCTQSIGDGKVLHGSVSTMEGHGVPPCAAATTTERERSRVPPPLESVHVDHGLQREISQLMAHGCVLQAWVWFKASHARPPHEGS